VGLTNAPWKFSPGIACFIRRCADRARGHSIAPAVSLDEVRALADVDDVKCAVVRIFRLGGEGRNYL